MIRPMRAGDADGIVKLVVAAEMFSPDEADVVRGVLDQFGAGSDEGHACLVDEQLVGAAYYQPKGLLREVRLHGRGTRAGLLE